MMNSKIRQSFMDFDFKNEVQYMPMIAVYDSPKDFTGKFVARLFDMDRVTSHCLVKDTLDEIIQEIPRNFVRMERSVYDVKCLVCTFL